MRIARENAAIKPRCFPNCQNGCVNGQRLSRSRVPPRRIASFHLAHRVLRWFWPEKKGYNRTVFLPDQDHAGDPRIFAESAGKKQLPPLWQAAGRQVGEGVVVVVAGGVVWWWWLVVWLVAGWLAGMVHGA